MAVSPMNNKSVLHFSYLVGCLVLTYLTTMSTQVAAGTFEYPSVTSDVPYSSVTALEYRDADEKIQYGEDPLQYALLWKASSASTNKPLIVLIHGGCWLNAFDIHHTFPFSTGLVQAGFDVWSLEYRRTGDEGGGWPGTFEDIKQGIAAASKYNDNYSLDNIIVAGHSAGGHLALLAGSEMESLKGIVGLAAIVDIEEYSKGKNSCQTVTKDFMQGTADEKPHAYALANPVKHEPHAKVMLLQGDADSIVPESQATNSNLPTKIVEKAGHFDWIHPGSDAFKSLIHTLQAIDKQ